MDHFAGLNGMHKLFHSEYVENNDELLYEAIIRILWP